MFDLTRLPKKISGQISGLKYTIDDMGKSGADILMFADMVLKIEKNSASSENERELLVWLDGKLPVPKVLEFEIMDGYSFLLMSKLRGEMACSDGSISKMNETVKALARGLMMLWQINISDCPLSNTVSKKMVSAKHRIENGLIDTNDFNSETFGEEGFSDVCDLYEYLDKNRPGENFVFSHGDFCLPNVFVNGADIAGIIDWSCGGIADRWQDIALCVRSLRHNYIECAGYGEAEYEKYKSLLFYELGIKPDEEKIRYYILLDELF